jgi:hypothetical protein
MPEETVADYDVRSPASRTLLTVIGTIVTVLLLGGMVAGASFVKRDTRVATADVELGEAAQLVINAGTADIRLVEGEEGMVRIRARITSGLRKTDYQLGRRGNEIKIVSDCQTWLSPGCGVSATLEVPKGLPVVVKTTSGDVKAEALAEGVLTVASGSGDVAVSDLRVDEFQAETGSGDIKATFATQPFGLKARTKSGDIRASVPAGKRKYSVVVSSKSGQIANTLDGDVTNSLGGDQKGGGFVLATTDSGDITLANR